VKGKTIMDINKFPFKKTFNGSADKSDPFSAINDAKQWLTEKGYSLGTMCRDEPIGITKGLGRRIEKWYHLNEEHKKMLDGVATSNDFRNGDVVIHLSEDPG
jgi:hypothetical protein